MIPFLICNRDETVYPVFHLLTTLIFGPGKFTLSNISPRPSLSRASQAAFSLLHPRERPSREKGARSKQKLPDARRKKKRCFEEIPPTNCLKKHGIRDITVSRCNDCNKAACRHNFLSNAFSQKACRMNNRLLSRKSRFTRKAKCNRGFPNFSNPLP